MSALHPRKQSALLVLVVATASAPALADALIPYMWVPMGQVFLLPLVVLIEAAFIHTFLGRSRLLALWHSFLMNLASTLVGAVMYIATGPLIGDSLYNFWWQSGFDWQRVIAIIISAIFAVVLFAISWVIETIVLRRLRPASPGMQVVRTTGIANGVTYVLLMGLAIAGA